MKITRSELKEMIKEVLREELSKKPLKEEKEFRSELKRLLSTPEGRAKFDSMPWKERQPLYDEDRKVDPVEITLNNTEDFELEYGGFTDDWYEDRWDPNSSYGHYQDTGTTRHGDFTYAVEASDMYEYIGSELLSIEKNHNKSPYVKEYFRLSDIWDATPINTVEADEAEEAMNLYLAQNLDEFFKIYEKEIHDHYMEDAYDWARN